MIKNVAIFVITSAHNYRKPPYIITTYKTTEESKTTSKLTAYHLSKSR